MAGTFIYNAPFKQFTAQQPSSLKLGEGVTETGVMLLFPRPLLLRLLTVLAMAVLIIALLLASCKNSLIIMMAEEST